MTNPTKWLCAQKKAWVLNYPLSAQRKLIRLGGCPGWSESSLGAQSLCWFCHGVAHFMDKLSFLQRVYLGVVVQKHLAVLPHHQLVVRLREVQVVHSVGELPQVAHQLGLEGSRQVRNLPMPWKTWLMCNQVRLKPACSATEASQRLWISLNIASIGIIVSR